MPIFINEFQSLTKDEIINIQLCISKGFIKTESLDYTSMKKKYESLVLFVCNNFRKLCQIYNITIPIEFGYLTMQILELELIKKM